MRLEPISKFFGACAVILLAVAVTAVWFALWLGMALSVLWGWFIVPVFGLMPITVAQAYGLMLVVRLITINIPIDNKQASTGQTVSRLILIPPALAGMSLFIGWIISAWV